MFTSSLTEVELLKRAQRLDRHALTAIHERYYPEVYRFALYRLGDADLAEDIASEVMLILLDALKRQRPPESSLRGWLFGVAANRIALHFRQRKQRPTQALPEDLPAAETEEMRLEQTAMRLAMEALTAEQQEVLALRFGDGFSLEDTAKTLNKTVSAVKALQFRAVASLKRLLDGDA